MDDRCHLFGKAIAAALAIAAAMAIAQPVARADAPQPAPLFRSYETLTLRLEAPFDDLFARGRRDPEYAVDGRLSDGGRRGKPLAVKVSLRGHTSRRDSECSFPKLKLDFADAPDSDSLFADLKTLKIGTHCGDADTDRLTPKFGRLPNERSPLREATVYRLLDALQVPSLRARPARITYVETAGGQAAAPEPVVRGAMLLEDEDDAMARFGAKDEITPEQFTNAAEMFREADAATMAFAQALIGNFDWCVKFTPTDTYRCDARLKLWNVIAAAAGDGNAQPLIYDFDVSGMVTGSHLWFADVFNEAFVASRSHREIEVLGQVQRTRTLFTRAVLDATRRRFLARREDAFNALARADVDDDGRRHIREYLDAFYRSIESDEVFYRPVVIASGTIPRVDGDPSAAAVCPSRGAMPIGTPVSDPIETRGDMIKVIVLDALWHWAPPVRCAPIHRDAVWIPAPSIGRDFPAR